MTPLHLPALLPSHCDPQVIWPTTLGSQCLLSSGLYTLGWTFVLVQDSPSANSLVGSDGAEGLWVAGTTVSDGGDEETNPIGFGR
jgi:hypothetical protein